MKSNDAFWDDIDKAVASMGKKMSNVYKEIEMLNEAKQNIQRKKKLLAKKLDIYVAKVDDTLKKVKYLQLEISNMREYLKEVIQNYQVAKAASTLFNDGVDHKGYAALADNYTREIKEIENEVYIHSQKAKEYRRERDLIAKKITEFTAKVKHYSIKIRTLKEDLRTMNRCLDKSILRNVYLKEVTDLKHGLFVCVQYVILKPKDRQKSINFIHYYYNKKNREWFRLRSRIKKGTDDPDKEVSPDKAKELTELVKSYILDETDS